MLSKDLHMTPELWETLQGMMSTGQMESFLEVIEAIKELLVSDDVLTNCVDSLGGADQVLYMLNGFNNMGKLFEKIHLILEARGVESE